MVKRAVQIIDKGLSYAHLILNVLAGASLLFIVISISYNVIGRQLFNSPSAWTVEVSEYLMVAICFLCAGWILKVDGHVKIEILSSLLSRKWSKILEIIGNSLGFLVSTITFYYALLIVLDHMNRNIVLLKIIHMPKHWVLFPIMLGFFFLSIQFFRNVLNNIIEIKEKTEDKEEHSWNGG